MKMAMTCHFKIMSDISPMRCLGASRIAKKSREHPAIFQKFSSKNPAGILDIWAKHALPLNEQGGSVLTAMMREMLRLAHTIR